MLSHTWHSNRVTGERGREMEKVVVFVDDPAVLQSVISALSSRPNYEVAPASNEQEVLSELSQKSILLTNLPTQGIGFLEQSDSAANSAPVIILTSQENEQQAVKALRSSATSYVPIRLIETELLGTIDSVLAVANAHQNRSRIMECVTQWHNEFVLENDRSLISPLVRYFQESTQRMGLLCEPGEETRLGIALEEALLNSMYHGNLEVSSELREEDDTRFYDLVEQRRNEAPYSDRRIRVTTKFCREKAVFVISDEGPGFDVSCVPDPTDSNNVERVCGRGMLLMRTFMDEVSYNSAGNEVTLVKKRQVCDAK